MKEKKKIEKQKSPGQQLMKAATLLKTNLVVIKHTGNLRKFGDGYCYVDGIYPNPNSEKVIIIFNKHPTSVKSKQNTTLFQALKYGYPQQKVSYK